MITYWDSSALVACLAIEEFSDAVQDVFQKSSGYPKFTSWVSIFEVETALRRKLNKAFLAPHEYQDCQSRWAELQSALNFVSLDEWVARSGARFQKLYGLKTGDAAQLGSANLIQNQFPEVIFATLDQPLSRYAKQEGFKTLETTP